MSCALRPQAWGPQTLWYWPLALTLPIVLAGGIIEKSTISPSLPEEKSYRSNQSDMVIESSSWRSEGADYEQWMEPPPPPPNRWRTTPSRPSNSGATQRQTEYFPEYEPGDPAFFNYQTREEEGQVKVFEFGR
jgi:hypothetical protein